MGEQGGKDREAGLKRKTENSEKSEYSEYSETSDDKHPPFRFPFSVFRSPVRFIQRCPVCGTPLVRGEEEASHYCPNDLHCAPQIIGRLEHFVSRKAMNISQVGPELIQQYYRNGMLHDVSDFYRITHDKKVADSVARSTEDVPLFAVAATRPEPLIICSIAEDCKACSASLSFPPTGARKMALVTSFK